MTKSILGTVARIRASHERSAMIDLAAAVQARRAQERALQELDAVLQTERNVAQDDAFMLAEQHRYALRMEMNRRVAHDRLVERTDEVDRSQLALRGRMQQTRVVERVQETRRDEETAEVRRSDRRALGVQGLMSWWRDHAA